jgi:hypothetical protein
MHTRGPVDVLVDTFVATIVLSLVTFGGLVVKDLGAGPGCPPIRYTLIAEQAPTGGPQDVAWAFAELSRVTRLPVIPTDATSDQPRVVVSWTEVPPEPVADAGLTELGRAVGLRRPGGMFSGTVMLSSAADLPVGTDERLGWRGVTLHELGHLVGLVHSADPADLMYPVLADGRAAFSATELRQLQRIGRDLGCVG